MKNIKSTLLKIWQVWKWFCTILVTGFVFVSLLYTAAIWVSLDFNPRFMAIDKCFDKGGRWDYTTNLCLTSQDVDNCVNSGGTWDDGSNECRRNGMAIKAE